jgi:alcohol dehydrogenase class IV
MNGDIFEFGIATRIISGLGAVQQIPDILKSLGGRKVLIVTDRGVDLAGLPALVTNLFGKDIPFSVYKDVEPNPTVENVEMTVAFCRDQSCDMIIAIGGGSVIDTSKSVGLLMTNPGSIVDYEGFNKFSKMPLPLIAIPTTTGSGSEVTRGQIVTDTKRNFKMIISGHALFPRFAILDPTMVTSSPPWLAATTGMDTLTHAVEAFASIKASPFTDALSYKAIELVGQNLRLFAANPSNLHAAMAMQAACAMAGGAFTNARLGNVHAMSHPLGGHYNLPHGLANAVLLPYVTKFNCLVNPTKFGMIARALGESTEGLTPKEEALKSVYAITKLLSDLGISPTLKNTGAKEEGISAMAEDAVKTGLMDTNPRRSTVDDIKELYKQAFAGDL